LMFENEFVSPATSIHNNLVTRRLHGSDIRLLPATYTPFQS
jgi:hypothetical protein